MYTKDYVHGLFYFLCQYIDMQCIYCGSEQLFTINSRTNGKNQVWRRRKCETCKKVFTTKEMVDLSHLIVIKRDGKKRRFKKSKVFCGIYNALREVKGSDRGVATQVAEELTEKVEEQLWHIENEVSSRQIAKIVLETLLMNSSKGFFAYLGYVNQIKIAKENNTGEIKRWRDLIKKAIS